MREYMVPDLEDFSKNLRREVVQSYGCDDDDRYITIGQIMNFIRDKFPVEDGEYVLDDDGLSEIIKFAGGVVVGGCLSEMAADGTVECSWDSEQNDMVFRLPEGEV